MMPDTSGVVTSPRSRFEQLYESNVADVWSFVRRRVSPADADDVTADVFAVAWRRIDDVPDDSARLWLFGVARNVVANHTRTMARRSRLHLRMVRMADRSVVEPPEVGPSLLEALGFLAPDDRDLLIMRAWDGLAVHEIAVVLGCTPNAASIRIHRARTALARALARIEKDDVSTGHVRGDRRP